MNAPLDLNWPRQSLPIAKRLVGIPDEHRRDLALRWAHGDAAWANMVIVLALIRQNGRWSTDEMLGNASKQLRAAADMVDRARKAT